MKLHRPIDLESFDEDFFSSNAKEEKNEVFSQNITDNISSPAAEEEILQKNRQSDFFTSALSPEIVEALMNIKPSAENKVFHDMPDDEPQEEKSEGFAFTEEPEVSDGISQVSEDEALKSFPDFEFDPEKFDFTENSQSPVMTDTDELKSSKQLREHKKQAKRELKDEKEKIKAQKRLEQQVQKPFRKKRVLSFLLALAVIVGILWAAFVAVLYNTGATPQSALNVGDFSLCYVDGTHIKSDEIKDVLILVKHEKIITSKQILFRLDNDYRVENVLAVGNDICAVAVSQKVLPVSSNDIIGDIMFTLSGIKPIYEIVRDQTVTALVGIIVYFSVIIGVFTPLIRRQNKKIKEYREDYQLVR